jgi:hypothetical protein
MSLDVQQDLLERAEQGEIDGRDFVECVRTSLPYAWDTIANLTDELAANHTLQFADNQIAPPDEQARGQLLRALASNAIRQALERHFAITLAFQNCHRVAVFPADATSTPSYKQFSSARAQLLNQSPLLRDC